MTWSRYSDTWGDQIEDGEQPLSLAARWHLHQLIARCSRTQAWDGSLRLSVALRVSDVDNPADVLGELVCAGQVVIDGDTLRVVHIDEHILPPSLRPEAVRERQRQARSRQGENRRHSDGHSDLNSDSPCDGHRGSHSFPGTHLYSSPPLPPIPFQPAIARIATRLHRYANETGDTRRATLRKRLASSERHLVDDALAHAVTAGWLTLEPNGRIRPTPHTNGAHTNGARH